MTRLRDFTFKDWVPYEGPRGGQGWQNTETQDVVYQEEKPSSPADGEERGTLSLNLDAFIQEELQPFKEAAAKWVEDKKEWYTAVADLDPEDAQELASGIDFEIVQSGLMGPRDKLPGRSELESGGVTMAVREGGELRELTKEEKAAVAQTDRLNSAMQPVIENEVNRLAEKFEDVKEKEALEKERRAEQKKLFERVKSEGEQIFIRFGDLPPGGVSYNHMDNRPEPGTSVYSAWKLPNGEVVADLREDGIYGSWVMLSSDDRPLYEVSGEAVEERGSDGEPLLRDPEIVGEVSDDEWTGAITYGDFQ